jgi:hypothetical protein
LITNVIKGGGAKRGLVWDEDEHDGEHDEEGDL